MTGPGSHRRRNILILLILTSITLITFDTRGGNSGVGGRIRNAARDVFAPIQDGIDSALRPVENWWDGVTRAGDIKDENRRLRRALQQARSCHPGSQRAPSARRTLEARRHPVRPEPAPCRRADHSRFTGELRSDGRPEQRIRPGSRRRTCRWCPVKGCSVDWRGVAAPLHRVAPHRQGFCGRCT